MRLLCLGAAAILGGCVGMAPGGPDDDVPDPVTPEPTTPKLDSILTGTFKPIAPYMGVDGRALMVRQLDGATEVSVAITGLSVSTMYTAHVHSAPCLYQGGGHYKIDPLVADTLETNEIWLKGQTSASGVLSTSILVSHLTRGEALSVVVHDPTAGAKMACADLLAPDVGNLDFAGTVMPLPGVTGNDLNIGGTITATRTATSTNILLSATGLDPAAIAYAAHIHAEPCSVTAGGGHYKMDTTVLTPVEANEIWLPLTSYATGTNTSMVAPAHSIRADAQAVVIHRTEGTVPIKVACANLVRTTPQKLLETSGEAIALAAASGMSLTGTAVMTRKLTGVTSLALVMTGLAPSTTYKAHVHNQACAVDSGGSHYKIDPAITDTAETNEIWFDLTSGADGSASDATWTEHALRADALSIVVHDPQSARLACFDL